MERHRTAPNWKLRDCLICMESVPYETSICRGQENSTLSTLTLCTILDLPQFTHSLNKDEGVLQRFTYCRRCSNEITRIQTLLENLEKLEKEVLDRKYEIELRLKAKTNNLQSNSSAEEPYIEFRNQVVQELTFNTTLSMMEKIKAKQIAKKYHPKSSAFRILKNVTIPKIIPQAPDDVIETVESDNENEVEEIISSPSEMQHISQPQLPEPLPGPSSAVKLQPRQFHPQLREPTTSKTYRQSKAYSPVPFQLQTFSQPAPSLPIHFGQREDTYMQHVHHGIHTRLDQAVSFDEEDLDRDRSDSYVHVKDEYLSAEDCTEITCEVDPLMLDPGDQSSSYSYQDTYSTGSSEIDTDYKDQGYSEDAEDGRNNYNCEVTHAPAPPPIQLPVRANTLHLRQNLMSLIHGRNGKKMMDKVSYPGSHIPIQHGSGGRVCVCSNCGTVKTTLWRRNAAGDPVCNACGLFFKVRGINRPVPVDLDTQEIKKRKRQPKPKVRVTNSSASASLGTLPIGSRSKVSNIQTSFLSATNTNQPSPNITNSQAWASQISPTKIKDRI